MTLPKGLADRFRASERLVSAPEGGRDYGSRGELVRRLVEAIDQRQTIAARYRPRSRGRRSDPERKLDPYHLRVAEEGIYLVARCHRSGEVKLFLVDRFDSVHLTEEHFMTPEGFDAEQTLKQKLRLRGDELLQPIPDREAGAPLKLADAGQPRLPIASIPARPGLR